MSCLSLSLESSPSAAEKSLFPEVLFKTDHYTVRFKLLLPDELPGLERSGILCKVYDLAQKEIGQMKLPMIPDFIQWRLLHRADFSSADFNRDVMDFLKKNANQLNMLLFDKIDLSLFPPETLLSSIIQNEQSLSPDLLPDAQIDNLEESRDFELIDSKEGQSLKRKGVGGEPQAKRTQMSSDVVTHLESSLSAIVAKRYESTLVHLRKGIQALQQQVVAADEKEQAKLSRSLMSLCGILLTIGYKKNNGGSSSVSGSEDLSFALQMAQSCNLQLCPREAYKFYTLILSIDPCHMEATTILSELSSMRPSFRAHLHIKLACHYLDDSNPSSCLNQIELAAKSNPINHLDIVVAIEAIFRKNKNEGFIYLSTLVERSKIPLKYHEFYYHLTPDLFHKQNSVRKIIAIFQKEILTITNLEQRNSVNSKLLLWQQRLLPFLSDEREVEGTIQEIEKLQPSLAIQDKMFRVLEKTYNGNKSKLTKLYSDMVLYYEQHEEKDKIVDACGRGVEVSEDPERLCFFAEKLENANEPKMSVEAYVKSASHVNSFAEVAYVSKAVSGVIKQQTSVVNGGLIVQRLMAIQINLLTAKVTRLSGRMAFPSDDSLPTRLSAFDDSLPT